MEYVNYDLEPCGFTDEIQKTKMLLQSTHSSNNSIGNIIDIQCYNDLMKLLRVTAFVLRFIHNLRATVKKETLTLNVIITEIMAAKFRWIKENQSSLTNEAYNDLKVNLNLQSDVDGVIR